MVCRTWTTWFPAFSLLQSHEWNCWWIIKGEHFHTPWRCHCATLAMLHVRFNLLPMVLVINSIPQVFDGLCFDLPWNNHRPYNSQLLKPKAIKSCGCSLEDPWQVPESPHSVIISSALRHSPSRLSSSVRASPGNRCDKAFASKKRLRKEIRALHVIQHDPPKGWIPTLKKVRYWKIILNHP